MSISVSLEISAKIISRQYINLINTLCYSVHFLFLNATNIKRIFYDLWKNLYSLLLHYSRSFFKVFIFFIIKKVKNQNKKSINRWYIRLSFSRQSVCHKKTFLILLAITFMTSKCNSIFTGQLCSLWANSLWQKACK